MRSEQSPVLDAGALAQTLILNPKPTALHFAQGISLETAYDVYIYLSWDLILISILGRMKE